jgi:hypothetical protein
MYSINAYLLLLLALPRRPLQASAAAAAAAAAAPSIDDNGSALDTVLCCNALQCAAQGHAAKLRSLLHNFNS